MDALFKWLSGPDYVPGSASDIYWSYLTMALSVLVAIGYAAIGFNRYLQSKLSRRAEVEAAGRRLLLITLCSILCGTFFFFYEMPWSIWRLYDCVLLFLLCITWSYAIRMRGVSLVDDRLSQMRALEESANRYRADIEAEKMLAVDREVQARRRTFVLNALSHDLRAPLNNVVLNAQMLKFVPPHEIRTCVQTIVESAKSAGDYATRLLDFARAGEEDNNDLEDVSVLATLNHVIRRFQPLAEQKGLYLRIASEIDVHVQTDRQKLERLIGNLVDNGVKYTRAGGVDLELILTDPEFCVRITDTGIGVPKANVPHLFDEFYQVNNLERDRSKGFGMGLAICKALADQLGGRVYLVNTTEQGSVFEVSLPKQSPQRGARSQTIARSVPPTEGEPICST